MMNQRTLLVPILLILFSACFNTNSPANRQKNVKYMKDTLGPIVLDYYAAHKTMPESFDIAHEESRKMLPNRGDYFGQPLGYEKTGESSFRFHSSGANAGTEDDITVEYNNGTWIP